MIPILLAAGATTPWHAQPEVVAKLSTPEQKKNIMRWLTRTARAGGNVDTAIDALRTIGIDWSELTAFSGNTVSERSTITNANVNETERMQDIRAILDQIQVMRR